MDRTYHILFQRSLSGQQRWSGLACVDCASVSSDSLGDDKVDPDKLRYVSRVPAVALMWAARRLFESDVPLASATRFQIVDSLTLEVVQEFTLESFIKFAGVGK